MREILYSDLAAYYDLIYSKKNYLRESERIDYLIRQFIKIKKKKYSLLDISCGTGSHIYFLSEYYNCIGHDINEEMLKIARKKMPDISFMQADMINPIKGKYDVIITLFSSINYVKTYENLKKVISNISKSMRVGGVTIIQSWFEPDQFTPGVFKLDSIDSDDVHISKLSVSSIAGGCSILKNHYLIGKNQMIHHFTDQHEMGLFKFEKIKSFMNKFGFNVAYILPEHPEKRGLIIGVKQ